jgi:lysozyme
MEILNDNHMIAVKKRIRKSEGYKNVPYQLEYTTTDGKKIKEDFYTVGVGHKLKTKEKDFYTNAEVDAMFDSDFKNAVISAQKILKNKPVPVEVLGVITDMVYQMGETGVSKFKKTLEHLDKGEYEKASKEMLNSKWATQTNERAVDLSNIISGLKGKY